MKYTKLFFISMIVAILLLNSCQPQPEPDQVLEEPTETWKEKTYGETTGPGNIDDKFIKEEPKGDGAPEPESESFQNSIDVEYPDRELLYYFFEPKEPNMKPCDDIGNYLPVDEIIFNFGQPGHGFRVYKRPPNKFYFYYPTPKIEESRRNIFDFQIVNLLSREIDTNNYQMTKVKLCLGEIDQEPAYYFYYQEDNNPDTLHASGEVKYGEYSDYIICRHTCPHSQHSIISDTNINYCKKEGDQVDRLFRFIPGDSKYPAPVSMECQDEDKVKFNFDPKYHPIVLKRYNFLHEDGIPDRCASNFLESPSVEDWLNDDIRCPDPDAPLDDPRFYSIEVREVVRDN